MEALKSQFPASSFSLLAIVLLLPALGAFVNAWPTDKSYINTTNMPWAWASGPVIRYVAKTKAG